MRAAYPQGRPRRLALAVLVGGGAGPAAPGPDPRTQCRSSASIPPRLPDSVLERAGLGTLAVPGHLRARQGLDGRQRVDEDDQHRRPGQSLHRPVERPVRAVAGGLRRRVPVRRLPVRRGQGRHGERSAAAAARQPRHRVAAADHRRAGPHLPELRRAGERPAPGRRRLRRGDRRGSARRLRRRRRRPRRRGLRRHLAAGCSPA